MSRIVLADELQTLRPLIADLASRYDSAEQTELLMECAVLAHELPRSLRSELVRFKLAEPALERGERSGLPKISGGGFPVRPDAAADFRRQAHA